ncbi:MAG: division/outer membrane stress-associated lipid-binding lipoprotein [Arsenophonus sp. ER-QC15-MAG3]
MNFFPIIIICSSLLLQGCFSAVVIGSAAIAAKSVTDPRSIGRQIDDGTLEVRVTTAINKDKEIIHNTRIIAIAYGGKILLIGQAPDLSLAERAKWIATNIEGVQIVYNEIRQALPVDFGISSKDTWITARIKSQIFIKSDLVKLLTVKVITENKEVFLLGILTKEEGEDVTKIVSETDGVKRVITAFTYID